MKSRQPGLWQTLASVRLTLFLLAGIIGISAIGTLIAQAPTSPVPLDKLYSPATLYFMKSVGLTDIFHSGWFIFLLSVLVVNLICATIERFPGVWKLALQDAPPAVQLDQIRKAKGAAAERHLFTEIKMAISREDFREFATGFGSQRVGPVQAIRDEGGLTELQLAAQTGRFSRIYGYLAHFAIVLILIGGVVGAVSGFEGRVSLDEGAKVGFIEVTRGNTKNWPLLRERGRVIPGFFEPGFEIELASFDIDYYPGTDKPRNYQSWIRFHEGGRIASTKKIAVNEPVEYRGIRFYQSGYSKTSGSVATVTVTDRKGAGQGQVTIPLAKESTYKLENASIRVLEIDEKVEELGPAMRIEYTEGNEAPRSFWIFQNFPRYDTVARKKARYNFSLDSIRPRFTSHIYLTDDPGARWVWIGSALLLWMLYLSLFRSHHRVWFVWTQKQVYLVGWSSRLFLFEPRFQRLSEQFRVRLARAAAKDKEKSP